MTDSTFFISGQGNGDGVSVSVYMCMNECQKRGQVTKALKQENRDGCRSK